MSHSITFVASSGACPLKGARKPAFRCRLFQQGGWWIGKVRPCGSGPHAGSALGLCRVDLKGELRHFQRARAARRPADEAGGVGKDRIGNA